MVPRGSSRRMAGNLGVSPRKYHTRETILAPNRRISGFLPSHVRLRGSRKSICADRHVTPYTTFNVSLGAMLVPFSFWLLAGNWREIGIASRIAFLMVVLAYPWDFFGVQLNVWNYPSDPGARLYGVPINDSVFICICTFLTASVLLFIRKRQPGR